MKNIVKGMLLSASALAFIAAPAMTTQSFAQTATTPAATPAAAAQQCNAAERDKLYNDSFTANYKDNSPNALEKRKIAADAAKEYLAKYNAPNCTDNAEIITYLQGWLPKYEAWVIQYTKDKKIKEFNDAFVAGDAARIFTSGKDLVASYPDDPISVSAMLIMADTGFVQTSNKKVDTYNTDTVATAKATIDKINAGKTPLENAWKPFASKEDALAWLNYDIAYINLYKVKDVKAAVPYFYQVTKYNSPDLSAAYLPYKAIGDVYLDQLNAAVETYNKSKDDTTVPEAKKDELNGTWKAYADRAMEAYGRAYAKAKANPKTKPETVKELNDTLTSLYQLRHNKETTGLDAYVTGLSSKPLTDPTTPITPVIEVDKTATATTSSPTGITASASNGEGSGGTERSDNSKAATPGAKGATTKSAATPASGTTKKPVPKKGKGK